MQINIINTPATWISPLTESIQPRNQGTSTGGATRQAKLRHHSAVMQKKCYIRILSSYLLATKKTDMEVSLGKI